MNNIFSRDKLPVEMPAPVRSVVSITLERDGARERIADLSDRSNALTTEKAALSVEKNPSASWRSEKIAEELQTLTSEIEKEGRFEKVLAYELAQLQLPAAREDAERLATKVQQALTLLDQAVLAAVPQVMSRAAKALALIEEANEAHSKAERISGESVILRRFDFNRQTIALLRPLHAFGASGFSWNEKMSPATGIPLGNLFLYGA